MYNLHFLGPLDVPLIEGFAKTFSKMNYTRLHIERVTQECLNQALATLLQNVSTIDETSNNFYGLIRLGNKQNYRRVYNNCAKYMILDAIHSIYA